MFFIEKKANSLCINKKTPIFAPNNRAVTC